MFYKKTVLKNLAIFTEKHLCWSLFLIKLRSATLFKRDSNTGFFLRILRNFEEHLQTSCFSINKHPPFTIVFSNCSCYQTVTVQKVKLSLKNFFGKCEQINSFIWICSHKEGVVGRCSVKKVFCKNSQRLRPSIFLKRDCGTGVFLWILRIFRTHFL